MNEIKFRAWCPNDKEMYFVEKLPIIAGHIADTMGIVVPFNYQNTEDMVGIDFDKSDNYDALEIMQYTGLKDKNGKEIYNDDIVKNEFGELFLVDMYGYHEMALLQEMQLEVVGNKYENPELLETLQW